MKIRRKQLTDQQKIDIVKKYLDGRSALSLSREYGIYYNAIYSLLKKRNIKIRNNAEVSRKYTLDINYFNKVDSEDKAYFLGLLYADGYNYVSRNAVLISLQDRDVDILEKFNQYLNHNKPLYFIKRNQEKKNQKSIYKIEINNRQMSQDLLKLGCMQNKALVLKFPTREQVPSHLLRHFVRGYFDGDGHIKERQCSIVSSSFFIDDLSKLLDDLGISYRVYQAKRDNKVTQRLCPSTVLDVYLFMDWIYKDANLYINRKHETYNKFLAQYKERIFSKRRKFYPSSSSKFKGVLRIR